MWVHRRPGDVPGWGAALGTGAAAAALTLARPPAALDGRGSTAVATAAVVAGTLVALAHRHRARYAVVIPGLVVLLLVAVLADAGPLAMLMLFELLFVGTLEARGVWRWCAWSVAGAVTVATIAAAVHQVVGQDHVMVLALQNVVLSGLAVWWAQNLRRMREQTQKVAAGSIAQELAARHERQASEARSALAVSAERVRLARDMHDIVAGRLAAVSLQASLAMRADDPGQVARAVREIKACADATLGEVRAMIDELGADGSTTPDLAECRRRLDDTVRVARSLGVDLTLREHGTDLSCPAGVTLYVVAQEVVANMVTHASPCRATLEIGSDQVAMTLRAWNSVAVDRQGSTGVRGGWGLANIANRIAPFAGRLEHGPTDDGSGWLVAVTVPRAGPRRLGCGS